MSPWSKTVLSFIFLAVFIYLGIGTLLYTFQRSFIYFPVADYEHSYDTEKFEINDVVITAIVLNKGNDNAVIYFGGNAEAVVGEADSFARTLPDHTVYLINYRGYADSTGNPTEAGLYADAEKLYDILSARHKSVSAIGRSLGTGVATYLASVRELNKVILVTPFDSIQRIAQEIYPVYPMSLLLQDKYDSLGRIDSIDSPVLVIVANQDSIVPSESTQRLIDAFPPGQIQVYVIEGAGHNTVSLTNKYYQVISQYLDEM